jgi:nucleoside 2-deoxyribosyltransferase
MKRILFRAKTRPTIYVAAALSHATEAFREEIVGFKDSLRPHAEVLDFLGLEAPSARDAFEWDIKCVRTCDVLVADVTHPSIGVGVEFGVALSLRKPIVTLAASDANPSRFVFGYKSKRHYSFRYRNYGEATQFVITTLRQLFPYMQDPKRGT